MKITNHVKQFKIENEVINTTHRNAIIIYEYHTHHRSWKFKNVDFNINGNYTYEDWQFLKEIILILEKFDKQIKQGNEPCLEEKV